MLIHMPMKLYCDNKATISIAQNLVQHDHTKHVEIDKHFIKEKIGCEAICMPFVPSMQQIADIFTKWLFRTSFELFISKLGMIDIYAPTLGGGGGGGVVRFLENKLEFYLKLLFQI